MGFALNDAATPNQASEQPALTSAAMSLLSLVASRASSAMMVEHCIFCFLSFSLHVFVYLRLGCNYLCHPHVAAAASPPSALRRRAPLDTAPMHERRSANATRRTQYVKHIISRGLFVSFHAQPLPDIAANRKVCIFNAVFNSTPRHLLLLPTGLLEGTSTHDNLKQAFAEESMAYMRYQYFAKIAEDEGFADVAVAFRSIAECAYYWHMIWSHCSCLCKSVSS
jgi:hypothetical protein